MKVRCNLSAVSSEIVKCSEKFRNVSVSAYNWSEVAETVNGVTFNNNYEADGHVNLKARKELTGKDFKAAEFTFKLLAADGHRPGKGGHIAGAARLKHAQRGRLHGRHVYILVKRLGKAAAKKDGQQ